MSGAITLSIDGCSEPWPVVDGKVDNLPLGPGGKLTSKRLKTKDRVVIESLSAFQQRLQEALDGKVWRAPALSATRSVSRTLDISPWPRV